MPPVNYCGQLSTFPVVLCAIVLRQRHRPHRHGLHHRRVWVSLSRRQGGPGSFHEIRGLFSVGNEISAFVMWLRLFAGGFSVLPWTFALLNSAMEVSSSRPLWIFSFFSPIFSPRHILQFKVSFEQDTRKNPTLSGFWSPFFLPNPGNTIAKLRWISICFEAPKGSGVALQYEIMVKHWLSFLTSFWLLTA